MSWRISIKILMISLVILSVAGCSTSLCKKRGVLFRGDWAFEINRTPWVGCPAESPTDADCEGKGFGFWKSKDKDDSPKRGLRNKVQCQHGNPRQNCAQCYMLNQGISPQHNAMNGISLSNLPPGSMVVPNGAIMPNGVFVPNSVLTGSMAGQTGGVQGSGVTGGAGGGGGGNGNTGQESGSGNHAAAAYGPNGQMSMMVPAANGMMTVVTHDGTTTQIPLAANGLLINPTGNQVVPGLSMSGYASPGYPPIGYSPTGYSPGYAQPYEMPPLAGNTGTGEMLAEEQVAESRAEMPYPRFNPVPTHPVFQRSMGMAPQYQAMQPPQVMPPNQLNMYGYPPALNPYAQMQQSVTPQNVLQQQMLYQAKLKEQAQRKAQSQIVAKQQNNQSKIILASQQSMISKAAAKRR